MAAPRKAGRKPARHVIALKKKFAQWLSMPVDQRRAAGEPETQGEFGEHYGVSAQTLSQWKHDPVVKQYVGKVALGSVTVEDIADVIETLKAEAKGGKISAIKELLDRTGIKLENPYDDAKEADIDGNELSAMSQQELEKLLAEEGTLVGLEDEDGLDRR